MIFCVVIPYTPMAMCTIEIKMTGNFINKYLRIIHCGLSTTTGLDRIALKLRAINRVGVVTLEKLLVTSYSLVSTNVT